jgi:ABC-type Fe3+-hydroxamate transport system substrate-binding protein
MKKLLILTILFAVLLAGCATAATPTPVPATAIPTPVYIEAGGVATAPDMASGIQVQVLSSPDPYAKVLATLNPGQTVEAIGYSQDGVWIVVKLDDGSIGWVPTQHVAVTIEN